MQNDPESKTADKSGEPSPPVSTPESSQSAINSRLARVLAIVTGRTMEYTPPTAPPMLQKPNRKTAAEKRKKKG